jgi:ATP phosphoribosyltransferase regulatory subunit
VFGSDVGTIPARDLYKFFDREGNTLVLRPDFTPSIARCAAKYFLEEEVPMRLCYLGNTFTNTSSLQGKLKEVTQMGVELINDDSVEADAEMLSLVVEALKNTGLNEFQICIGHSDFFKGLCEEAGLDDETEEILRDLISGKNYFAAENLLRSENIPEIYTNAILKVADMFGDIDSLKEFKDTIHNNKSKAAIERLEKIYEVLKLYDAEEYVSFDLGMLSQYQYYTGIIFKAYTYGIGDAIVKGGRYNNLLRHFGKNAPAIGFAIVIDDMQEALSRQKVSFDMGSTKKVITYTTESYAEKLAECIEYRKKGLAVELIPEK